ncbi:MAG: hypothetical protein IJO06_04585 [Thermoguttaceae bacterium]|nr:hypothetical protein [Thermoguttaceae bacterium]
MTACQRPGLASVAVYVYPRGGSKISGPSIRLAEEIARNWATSERLGPKRTPRRYVESPRLCLG